MNDTMPPAGFWLADSKLDNWSSKPKQRKGAPLLSRLAGLAVLFVALVLATALVTLGHVTHEGAYNGLALAAVIFGLVGSFIASGSNDEDDPL